MAYQTGSATSANNLLDAIRIFLTANGWTINFWGDDPVTGAGNKFLAVKSPSGSFFHMLSYGTAGEIFTTGATGWNSGSNRNSQPGQAGGWAKTNGVVGPFPSYHLFVSDTYCHVVIEVTTNRFTHFHIGVLEKGGNFVGGEYYTNTYWTYGDVNYQNVTDSVYHSFPFDGGAYYGPLGGMRADIDGTNDRWLSFSAYQNSTVNAQGFLRGNSMVNPLVARSPNILNGMSTFAPSVVIGPRPLGGVSIYGTVKDLRPVNIRDLSPKQVITIGTDQWMIFPIIRKGAGSVYESVSGNYGLAYRVVT